MFNLLFIGSLCLLQLWQVINLPEKELKSIIELRQDQKPFITNSVRHPELLYSYQFNLELGQVYLNLKEHHLARRQFQKLLQLTASELDKGIALYYLGRSFLLSGDFDSAVKYLGKVLEHNSNPGLNFLYDYGIALYKIGRDEDAFTTLTNLFQQLQIETVPNSQLYKKRRHKIIEWQGNQYELLTLLGLLALKTKKDNQAIIFLEAIPAIQRQTSIPEANYLLALAYYQIRQLQKAESLLRESQKVLLPLMLKLKAWLLLGTIQLEQGEEFLAIETFSKILQDTFRQFQDQAYLRSGIAKYRTNDYEDAIHYFQTLINQFPESDLMEYGMFYSIQTYRKLKENRRAIEMKRELQTRFPQSKFLETAILDIAKLYYQERNFNSAFRELNNFLKLFNRSVHRSEVMYLCALSAIQIKEDSLAQVLLKQLVDSFPESPYHEEAIYRIGVLQLAKHQFESAKNNFCQIESGRFYPYSLKGIGDVYIGLANYDSAELYYHKAESVLIQAIQESPKGLLAIDYSDSLLADLRLSKETARLKAGKYTSYIEMLKYYLLHYPPSYHTPKLQFEIGLYYYEKRNYVEAIKEFYKVFNYIPDEPTKAKAHLFIARSQLNLNQIEDALKTFHYIITNFSDTATDIVALNYLAEIHTQSLAYDSAINCYLYLIEKYPKTKEAQKSLLDIAGIYKKLGKTTEAKLTLDRLIKEYPKSELHKPAYLEMIDLMITEGNLAYAETLTNQYNKKFGSDPMSTLQLGRIRSEQNRIEEAKNLFLSASAQLKGDHKAEVLFLVADASLKLSDTIEAKNCLKQAIQIAESERLKMKYQETLNRLHKR